MAGADIPNRPLWLSDGDSVILVEEVSRGSMLGLRLLLPADLVLPGEGIPALLFCVSICTGTLGDTLVDLQALGARPRTTFPTTSHI